MHINSLLNRLRPLLAFSPMTVRQLAVLLVLAESGQPVEFHMLASNLLFSKPATSRSVDALAELKLASRARDLDDRRRVYVSITDAGRQLLGSMGVA